MKSLKAKNLVMENKANNVSVYYDGACPVCTKEIGFYQRQVGAGDINWVDVARCDDNALPMGVTREAALARFHVVNAKGMTDGAPAFIALWCALPRFRFIGRVLSVPPMPTLLNWAYAAFLRLRKLWR
jgi:predicted DCC family thiol-disulfide oxidoreductase YuxK